MLKKDYVAKLHRALDEMRTNGDLTEVKNTRYERDSEKARESGKNLFSRLTGKTAKSTNHWDDR